MIDNIHEQFVTPIQKSGNIVDYVPLEIISRCQYFLVSYRSMFTKFNKLWVVVACKGGY